MKALTNWRYYILLIIAGIATLGIFSIPDDDLSTIDWMKCLLISKLIGVSAFIAYAKLIKIWEKRNLIPELSNLIKEDE